MYANEDAKIVSEFSEFYGDAKSEFLGFYQLCQRDDALVILDLDSECSEADCIVDDFSDCDF
jgi:hypothetical protein